MEPRISLVTLGVSDIDRARSFYRALGFTPSADSSDEVVFFQAGCMALTIWDREELAADSGVEDDPGWGGITLAHNVGAPGEVDSIIEEARAAGASISREPGPTFWGGYSGAFVDPDGHPWEIAHNPGWHLDSDGSISLPV